MYPPEVKAKALTLIDAGLNDCEISRRLGVPRRTILHWRKPAAKRYVRRAITERCPRCWRPAKPIRFTPGAYAELLGLYLGDGCISRSARTARLRIALDARYPGIISETTELLERAFPLNPVGRVSAQGGTMFFVSVYSTHLACLFPQHDVGPKHRREIKLEPWQAELLEAAPWAFIRGCIRSDGCVFVNRTGPYDYLSYDFCNMSPDIADLFVEMCQRVGVVTRLTVNSRGLLRVRINRRASVALMLDHVGLKE
jgi:hypothetical protein